MTRAIALALPALLIAVSAVAAERSAPLSLEAAREIIAGAGLNRGRTFALADGRYAITDVTVDRHGTEFTIRVVIDPLAKVAK